MGMEGAGASSSHSRPGNGKANYGIEVLSQSRTSRLDQQTTAFCFGFFCIFSSGNLAEIFFSCCWELMIVLLCRQDIIVVSALGQCECLFIFIEIGAREKFLKPEVLVLPT